MASQPPPEDPLRPGLLTEANLIVDRLFLGSVVAAEDLQAMRKRKISHILVCHPDLPAMHAAHFKYSRVPLVDDPSANLLELLPDALEFLCEARDRGTGTFVYCAKGISRSASCAIALLMLERGVTFEEAWRVCEQRRPSVYPNLGFQEQLRFFGALLRRLDRAPGGGAGERRQRAAALLRALREAVPRGSLEAPGCPLRLREAVGGAVARGLDEVEALAERCLRDPQLARERGVWRRHGLFFENVRQYKVLPAPSAASRLLRRAREAAGRLGRVAEGLRPAAGREAMPGEESRALQLVEAIVGHLTAWSEIVATQVPAPVPAAAGAPVPLGGDYDSDSDVGPGSDGSPRKEVLGGAYDSSGSGGEEGRGGRLRSASPGGEPGEEEEEAAALRKRKAAHAALPPGPVPPAAAPRQRRRRAL